MDYTKNTNNIYIIIFILLNKFFFAILPMYSLSSDQNQPHEPV